MRQTRKKRKLRSENVHTLEEVIVSNFDLEEEVNCIEVVDDPLLQVPIDTVRDQNVPDSVKPSVTDDTIDYHTLNLVNENNDETSTMSENSKAIIRKKKKCAKLNREIGKEYLGYRRCDGKVKQDVIRLARKQRVTCNSKYCRKSAVRKCNLFSGNERTSMFDYFWKMNWDQKKLYICNLIDVFPKKTGTNDASRRNNSRTYYLMKPSGTEGLRVCQKMFFGTLGLNEKMVRVWLSSKQEFGMFENPRDVRERKTNKMKQSESYQKKQQKKNYLREYLMKLPKLESHYCRKDTKKEYLQTEHRSYTDVYKDYVKFSQDQNRPTVSMSTFSIMLKELNYCLFKPRKDQCDDCVAYKVGNVTELEHRRHRNEIEASRKEKERDMINALNKLCTVLTMDVQAVMLCPSLLASALYFSLKLQVHNFTIYDNVSHKSVNYVWDETEGEMKASIFTSIIVSHIENLIKNKLCCKTIIIYSDGCGYQNRNTILSSALSHLTKQYPVIIYQKFLVKGHTQMECDSSHALIERKKKNKEINSPSDIIEVIKKARSKPCALDVVNLTHKFFRDYEDPSVCVYKSIRPGKIVGDPCVNNLRCIKYVEGSIFYKLSISENYKILPHQPLSRQIIEPKQLYLTRLQISAKKFKDLQELKYVLPLKDRKFYDDLPHF